VTIASKQTAARFVVLISLLGIPRAANADVAACVQAHASGQREAKAGHLEAASELFASCVSLDGCPDTIRAECAEFYKNTERSMPTLIFAALDERGGDLIQVRVSADDRVLTETLDGRPIALDPGEHHFKFELASGELLESDVLVHQGEKNRIVSMRAKLGSKPVEETPAPSAEATSSRRQLPASFWIASGVSAAALVSFGTFALVGHGKQSTLNDCSPSCSANHQADYDTMRRDYLIADISLGVAVPSAGVAAWLFLRSDRPATTEQQAAVSPWSSVGVTPLVSTRGAGLVLNASAF
jgi:hypothetical protein